MGFKDFFKKIVSTDDDFDDAELSAARAKHGIVVNEAADKKEAEKEERESYDPWEEVRNARMSFFMGSWATKKFHVVGEDKVKAELEALDKKREEEEKGGIKTQSDVLDKKQDEKKGK
jgi:hypothetical protein